MFVINAREKIELVDVKKNIWEVIDLECLEKASMR